MTERRHRIFVVDDEPDLVSLYQDILQDEHEVLSALSPDEFLQKLKSGGPRPDLVISDYSMPGMNGLDMIRAAFQMGHDFPFLILSGHLTKEVVLRAVTEGVFRILEKPVHADQIRGSVEELLLEFDLIGVREEIRGLTGQLREAFASFRLVTEQYVPAEIAARMIVEADQGSVKRKLSFDDLLAELESRLDLLVKTENTLLSLRSPATRRSHRG